MERLVILLETINPYDLLPEDLQELADAINADVPELDVEVAYEEQYGAGTTWHEVVHVWLPSASFLKDAAYSALIASVTKWARDRFKRKEGKHRPRSLIIHDMDGRDLGTIVLHTADADAVFEAPEQPCEEDDRRRSTARLERPIPALTTIKPRPLGTPSCPADRPLPDKFPQRLLGPRQANRRIRRGVDLRYLHDPRSELSPTLRGSILLRAAGEL